MTTQNAADLRLQLLGSPPRRIIAVADTAGVTRHLTPRMFTDLSQRRVGVLARPGMRRIGWLAADTLLALGCRDDVTGAGRAGEGDWTLVAVWLNTHRIEHLYIQNAWTMLPGVLEQVTRLVERTSCTVWLVGDTPITETQADIIASGTAATITGEQFTAAWSDLRPAEPAGSRGEPEPMPWPARVPDDDFTTFRSACRDLLAPEEFGVVDAYFRREVVALRSAIADMVAAETATEENIAELLADHWEAAESLAHYVTFIRAAQVACFQAGRYLQVDLDQLIGTAATMPRRATRTPETWERLHAYPEPHRGAICALAAAGLAVADIRKLTPGGYDPSTGTVTLPDGRTVEVEPAARIFLRAQQHLRDLQDAGRDDPLFPTRDGTPLSEAALVTVINTARRELGVAVAPARLDRKSVTGDRWMTRWGVSIQELL